MSELENDQTPPPEPVGESITPLSPDEMSPGEPAPLESPGAKPAKHKRIAEKYGTRKWWLLFLLGLVGFFVLNTLLAILGFYLFEQAGNDFRAPLYSLFWLVLWLIMYISIIVITLNRKQYAALLGYIAGYIVNFIISIAMHPILSGTCGQPFYLSVLQ